MLRRRLDFFRERLPGIYRWFSGLASFILVYVPTWLNIFRIRKSNSPNSAILYLTNTFPRRPPTRSEAARGGTVKLTYLSESFPHYFPAANLAYIVTTVGHPLQDGILERAKQKGLKLIINHDGVAFPAWAGSKYIEFNKITKRVLDLSDFIVYQSKFSKWSADLYLAPPEVPCEIIYNPVDTSHFSPKEVEKPGELTLLLGGNQYEKYRLELALQTLQSLLGLVPNARLIVTGNLWRPAHQAQEWTARALKEMGLSDHVEFVGKYTQADAPYIYSRAHMLLHTKYADPCPGLVIEALGCGLPVVHVGNGGVPELVEDAGISVSVEHSWEKINLPEPKTMAEAVLHVYSDIKNYSQVARQQAQKFDLGKFIARHKDIFERLLEAEL